MNTLEITGEVGAYHFEVYGPNQALRKVGSGSNLDEIERVCRARFGDDLEVVNKVAPVPVVAPVAAEPTSAPAEADPPVKAAKKGK